MAVTVIPADEGTVLISGAPVTAADMGTIFIAYPAVVIPAGLGTVFITGAASQGVDLTLAAQLVGGRFTAITNPSRFDAAVEIDMPTIYATAGNRVYVGVILTETTGIDITSDTLVMGLALAPSAGSSPQPPTQSYSPDIDTDLFANQRLVKLLVGDAGTIDPDPGTYIAWVQDTSTPEIEWVPCLNQTVTII